ncbi:MAG: hypothetical protein ACYTGH_14360, partial [Planctomycetota bacterium]
MTDTGSPPKTSPSLSRQLTLGLLMLIVLIETGLMGWIYLDQSRELQARHEEQADKLETLVQTLSNPLWELDFEQAQRVATVLFHDPLVAGLLIQDEHHQVRFRQCLPSTEGSSPERIIPIRHDDKAIGSAHVWLDLNALKGERRRLQHAILISLLGVASVTIFGTGLLLRHLLKGPLADLEERMVDLAGGRQEDNAYASLHREFIPIAERFKTMSRA